MNSDVAVPFTLRNNLAVKCFRLCKHKKVVLSSLVLVLLVAGASPSSPSPGTGAREHK